MGLDINSVSVNGDETIPQVVYHAKDFLLFLLFSIIIVNGA